LETVEKRKPSSGRPGQAVHGFSLTAVLGNVLIHVDARLFAPAVNPSGLVKGVDECFDFVAGLSQLLNGFAKLARSGGVLVQQPVPFIAVHSVSQSYPSRVTE
jgi:hypothetical protein